MISEHLLPKQSHLLLCLWSGKTKTVGAERWDWMKYVCHLCHWASGGTSQSQISFIDHGLSYNQQIRNFTAELLIKQVLTLAHTLLIWNWLKVSQVNYSPSERQVFWIFHQKSCSVKLAIDWEGTSSQAPSYASPSPKLSPTDLLARWRGWGVELLA